MWIFPAAILYNIDDQPTDDFINDCTFTISDNQSFTEAQKYHWQWLGVRHDRCST